MTHSVQKVEMGQGRVGLDHCSLSFQQISPRHLARTFYLQNTAEEADKNATNAGKIFHA